jgi:2-polyprenyl-3-methyl-5-hydroxy-6-metoxy-1,4-benzoquinol methylase
VTLARIDWPKLTGVGAVQLERIAKDLYTDGPWLMRKMMHFRIRICPYERLIAEIPAGCSVLDIGCGGGLLLALLAGCERLGSGVGFDSSRPAIETAMRMQDKLRQRNPSCNLHFFRLDVAETWPSGQYDVVSLIDVLHHVPRSQQATVFEMAANKVKPGGLLVYKDMSDHLFLPAVLNRLHDLVLARQWINYVSTESVEAWARDLGLLSQRSDTMSRLWYRHYLNIFSRKAFPESG